MPAEDYESAKYKCDKMRRTLPAVYNVERLFETPIPELNPSQDHASAQEEIDQKILLPALCLDANEAEAFETIFNNSFIGATNLELDETSDIDPFAGIEQPEMHLSTDDIESNKSNEAEESLNEDCSAIGEDLELFQNRSLMDQENNERNNLNELDESNKEKQSMQNVCLAPVRVPEPSNDQQLQHIVGENNIASVYNGADTNNGNAGDRPWMLQM